MATAMDSQAAEKNVPKRFHNHDNDITLIKRQRTMEKTLTTSSGSIASND